MKAPPILLAAGLFLTGTSAGASPMLLVDASSGNILEAQEATRSWHPASLTKLMTAHLTLLAVEAGRLSMDTSIVMSARAVAASFSIPVFPELRPRFGNLRVLKADAPLPGPTCAASSAAGRARPSRERPSPAVTRSVRTVSQPRD